MLITSDGKFSIYKYLNSSQRFCLGRVPEGELIGDIQIMFDSNTTYSMEADSYCSIGSISTTNMHEIMFRKFPHMYSLMKTEILENPYDPDREFFIK